MTFYIFTNTRTFSALLVAIMLLSYCNYETTSLQDTQDNIDTKNVSTKLIKEPYQNFEQAKNLNIEQLEIAPYEFFDTILSNGYYLSYRVRKDSISKGFLQSLTLTKNNIDIKELNEITYPLPQKNLGYIGADFGSTFVFVQSYGSGNPHYIQLMDKRTGIELKKGAFVDTDEKEKILLYIENLHKEDENLVLLDLLHQKELIINDFENFECSDIGGLRNCIKLDTITKNIITIEFISEDSTFIKSYNR